MSTDVEVSTVVGATSSPDRDASVKTFRYPTALGEGSLTKRRL